MQAVKPFEANSLRTVVRRLRGAHEAELFGPRGRLPRRGEPDTSHNRALLVLAGLVLGGLALRLAVPRGIWLDEAISIHQARLSLHDLFSNLYNGDRQPPLYHLVLWLTVRAFGHGEFAVRLPSLIAGTLVIPVLYELGRELYDRRTGLVAAAFAAPFAASAADAAAPAKPLRQLVYDVTYSARTTHELKTSGLNSGYGGGTPTDSRNATANGSAS